MQKILLVALLTVILAAFGFSTKENTASMAPPQFIEITVQNHLISHGFDEHHKEIIEEVVADKPTKKFLSVDRIQSVSEKYILTTYGYGRLVYWEYEGSYEELKQKLVGISGHE